MPTKTKILIVMGTRPEVIKLAPVVIGARNRPDEFETFVVTTSQHREMLDAEGTTPAAPVLARSRQVLEFLYNHGRHQHRSGVTG